MLAGCGPGLMGALPGACGLGASIALPLEMRAQAPVLSVVINERSARLVLDTGSNATILNQEAAAILGVYREAGPVQTHQTVGGARSAERGSIDSLRLGTWTLSAVPVSIMAKTPEDGVLGLDVLQNYDVDVNLAQREVVLHEGGLCPGEAPPMSGEVLQIPAARAIMRTTWIGRRPEPYLAVPVSLDGAKAFALLDTGAAVGSLVSVALAAKAGVDAALLEGDAEVGLMAFGTPTRVRRHQFGELLIGRERFIAPSLLVGGDPQAVFPMIIGADCFLHHRVWFNFAADRIFVARSAR